MEKEFNPEVNNVEKVALINSVTKLIDVADKIDLIELNINNSDNKEEFAALSIVRFNVNRSIDVMLEVLEHRNIKFEDGKFYEQVASIEVETPQIQNVNFEENTQQNNEEHNDE